MLTFIGCLIVFVVWLGYEKRKGDKSAKEQSDAFWTRERESNLTRKKDLSALDYITIPFEKLPFSKDCDDEMDYVQQQIQKLKQEKIVNLSDQSNTDLKLTYGTANLNELSRYDQNYTVLIRTLNKWGLLLYNNHCTKDARTVFEYAISIGSDISQTYLTLAGIYSDEHNLSGLSDLIENAKATSSPLKDSIVSKLTAIQSRLSSD